MNINYLNPKTVAVLDILTNNKPYSSTGSCRDTHEYITHMEYRNKKEEVLITIPYQANQLLEQALYLIQLANHCIENDKNIQY
jgi:hypothetical protein